MKKTTTLIVTILFVLFANAQCITGDCENGTGTGNFMYGIYTGQWKNGLPNGEGVYKSTPLAYSEILDGRDSIKYTGYFCYGIFIKGIKDNYGRYGVFNKQYYPYKTGDINQGTYWFRFDPWVRQYEFPKKGKENVNGERVEFYELGSDIHWVGDLKKGYPHGKGVLKSNSIYINTLFDKGEIKSIGSINAYSGNENDYRVAELLSGDFENGSVVNAKYYNKILKRAYEAKFSILLYDVFTKYLQSGEYTLTIDSATKYEGNIMRGEPSGPGKITYANGSTFEGNFMNSTAMGMGKYITPTQTQEGIFTRNKFSKGTIIYSTGKKINYPKCIAGDCENGFGEAEYILADSDSAKERYKGNFVDGLRSGYGELTIVKIDKKETVKGNFLQGFLHGDANVTANKGWYKNISGKFYHDSLTSGTIVYYDNTSFQFFGKMINQYASYEATYDIIHGNINSKKFSGVGIYTTKQGASINGFFEKGKLNRGNYTNKDGLSLNMIAYEYWTESGGYYFIDRDKNGVDDMDASARYKATIIEIDRKEAEAKALAYQQQLQEKERMRLLREDPNNWKTTTSTGTCSACGGLGTISYSNTFGGNINTQVMTSSGWANAVVERTGRTYTHKTKCSQCNGRGRVTTQNQVFTEPSRFR
jgi:hypothetical protein